jgi:hypothetical protein
MTTPEQIRNAWDNIATGFDEFVTPMTIPWRRMLFASSICVRHCGSWTWRLVAGL